MNLLTSEYVRRTPGLIGTETPDSFLIYDSLRLRALRAPRKLIHFWDSLGANTSRLSLPTEALEQLSDRGLIFGSDNAFAEVATKKTSEEVKGAEDKFSRSGSDPNWARRGISLICEDSRDENVLRRLLSPTLMHGWKTTPGIHLSVTRRTPPPIDDSLRRLGFQATTSIFEKGPVLAVFGEHFTIEADYSQQPLSIEAKAEVPIGRFLEPLVKLINDSAGYLYERSQAGVAIHGSALALDGRCLLLVGESGFGKSTLLTHALHRHSDLSMVTDDLTLCTYETEWTAHGLVSGTFLRAEENSEPSQERHSGESREYVPARTRRLQRPFFVHSVWHLRRASSRDVNVQSMDPEAAWNRHMTARFAQTRLIPSVYTRDLDACNQWAARQLLSLCQDIPHFQLTVGDQQWASAADHIREALTKEPS